MALYLREPLLPVIALSEYLALNFELLPGTPISVCSELQERTTCCRECHDISQRFHETANENGRL